LVFLAQYYGVIPETPQALSGIYISSCASLEMDPGQAARARLSGVTALMALMN
jgi:hypothetical protein